MQNLFRPNFFYKKAKYTNIIQEVNNNKPFILPISNFLGIKTRGINTAATANIQYIFAYNTSWLLVPNSFTTSVTFIGVIIEVKPNTEPILKIFAVTQVKHILQI